MSVLKSIVRQVAPEWLYDGLRRRKRDRMTASFSPYTVEGNYGGRTMKMRIADPVGEEWYASDWKSVPEIDFLGRFDLTGGTIFDIGAHQCLVAMLLADQVGDEGKVIAVEANDHNHAVSLMNFQLNGRQNITCVKALVSSGNVTVAVDGGLNARARSSGSAETKTDILTVDQMTAEYGSPSLVFMDIEGHEIEALAGAQETLRTGGCHWFIELHGDDSLATYGHRNSDVFKYFDDERFLPHILEEDTGSFKPLTRDSLPATRCHIFFERRQG